MRPPSSTIWRDRPFLRLFAVLLSAFFILHSALAQTNQVTPTWTFETFGLQPFGSKRIVITPMRAVGNNGNLLAIGDPIRGTTTNSSFTTNLLNGSYYRVEFFSGFNVYGITNFFDANAVGAVDGGDPFYRAFGQPQDRGAFAPSLAYGMAIWMLKYSGVATNPAFYGSIYFRTNGSESTGWVWTLTNTATGQGDWKPSTGGGGGGGTGNVTGPNSSTIGNVAIFSSTDGAHIGDGGTLGTAAFQPVAAFDAFGAANTVQGFVTAYSNSVNIASGLSAAVPTNRWVTPTQLNWLSNNIDADFLTVGTVPTLRLGSGGDGSGTHFYADDHTFKSIPGGGDMLRANNLTDVANTATALANLNGTPNTRALTINGTANQIASSAGSQNLTADRTWTLSLSSTLIAPGTLNVTSDQTNQATLSVTGNQTNFANLKVVGNQTNVGTFSVTGNQTNSTGLYVAGSAALQGGAVVTGDVTGSGNGTFSGTVQGTSVKVTSATASTMAVYDSSKSLVSIANPGVSGTYVPTNNGLGGFGYAPAIPWTGVTNANQFLITDANTNPITTLNGAALTNTVQWTHEGTATNITATFNGTIQSYTITNGPTVYFHFLGANGSISYRIYSTNFTTLALDFQPKWLTGSNSVCTNGVITFTSYGGTNTATPSQLEAAMRENQ